MMLKEKIGGMYSYEICGTVEQNSQYSFFYYFPSFASLLPFTRTAFKSHLSTKATTRFHPGQQREDSAPDDIH